MLGNNEEITEILLKSGALINSYDEKGRNALHYAALLVIILIIFCLF